MRVDVATPQADRDEDALFEMFAAYIDRNVSALQEAMRARGEDVSRQELHARIRGAEGASGSDEANAALGLLQQALGVAERAADDAETWDLEEVEGDVRRRGRLTTELRIRIRRIRQVLAEAAASEDLAIRVRANVLVVRIYAWLDVVDAELAAELEALYRLVVAVPAGTPSTGPSELRSHSPPPTPRLITQPLNAHAPPPRPGRGLGRSSRMCIRRSAPA